VPDVSKVVLPDVPIGVNVIGLFGYPLEHSLSAIMHNAAFAACGLSYHYVLLPSSPEDFGGLVTESRERGLAGWNVTVPHKEKMLRYLDGMSAEVAAVGACNTVRVDDGKLIGFNTDVHGFLRALAEAGGIEAGGKAIVLGAGGASRAVAWALASTGHDLLILSRRPEQAEVVANCLPVPRGVSVEHGALTSTVLGDRLNTACLLVNCSPVGQWPHTDENPLPPATRISQHVLVYDLIYRPRPTRLLRQAAAVGCRTQDGLEMLVQQGAAAFAIWTGREAPVEVMRNACLDALSRTREPEAADAVIKPGQF
jgi:shikimate dehydrogenase